MPFYNLFVYVLSNVSPQKEVVLDTPVLAIQTPAITTTSLTEQYIQRQTARLLNTYNTSLETQRRATYSENIDTVFYTKSQWSEVLKDENNYLEKKWQTKILIENTPRGNIIMYYDAYKLGFAYYSDQTMPYPVLNAVAMKYVLTFFCRDFFMDEIVLSDTNISGITKKHKEDADAEREVKKQTIENTKSWRFESKQNTTTNTNPPFAKFKSYNNVSSKSTNVNVSNKSNTANGNMKETTLAEPKQTNRFIYLGKTRNVSFLQKPEIIPIAKNGLAPNVEVTENGSGSLQQSGIYSIFSPSSTVANFSFDNNIQDQISTPPPQLETPCADNKSANQKSKSKSTPLQKQQITYAEYKRFITENK